MTEVSKSRRRRVPGWLAGGVVLVAVGAVLGWAMAAVFAPPPDVLSATSYTTVRLAAGEVGSSIDLNSVAAWKHQPAGTNQAVGTVTSVAVAPGGAVSVGAVLYSVNLRPVVIAQGETPAFRALAKGTKGADVAQLQTLLTSLGLYSGAQDGDFGWRTEQGVRAWQTNLGVEVDGVVQPGDLVFVQSLPTRVSLDVEKVYRGASLSGGEAVVSVLAAEPTFTIPVAPSQAAMMPAGTSVEIKLDDQVWKAEVAGQDVDPAAGSNQVIVRLQGVGGGSICGTECGRVPVSGEALLRSTIITQATVEGVVVPSSALLTSPDGTISLVEASGRSHPVTVVASARGMSVIDGADAGMMVRVPATDGETRASS